MCAVKKGRHLPMLNLGFFKELSCGPKILPRSFGNINTATILQKFSSLSAFVKVTMTIFQIN